MKHLLATLSLLFVLLPGLMAAQIEVFVQSYYEASVTVGDAHADYHQTNNRKSQLTAGNSLELRLYDLPEGTLQRVTLSVKSNAASGAGEMTLTMADQLLWSIPNSSFKSNRWNGAYSTAYVNLSKDITTPLQDTLVLRLKATENSLYFQSLTLDYEPVAPVVRTVQFETGTFAQLPPLVEAEPGQGIVLPTLDDPDPDWRFFCWAMSPVEESSNIPMGFMPDTRFIPPKDLTLYAVYNWRMNTITAESTLHSGEYLIVQRWLDDYFAAAGGVDMKSLPTQPISFIRMNADSTYSLQAPYIYDDLRYELLVNGDSLYIRHKSTASWVGFDSQHHLAEKKSLWHYVPARYGSVMLETTIASKSYMLYIYYNDISTEDYPFSLQYLIYNTDIRWLLLFPVDEIPSAPVSPRYTTYPLGHVGLETIVIPQQEGIYDLLGRYYGTSAQSLPSGIYIHVHPDNPNANAPRTLILR